MWTVEFKLLVLMTDCNRLIGDSHEKTWDIGAAGR